MPESKGSAGSPEGEHIEELLSQLKGIFGHLSESEQDEAKQKITPPPHIPAAAPKPAPAPEPPPAADAQDPVPTVPMDAAPAESPPESIPDAAFAAMDFQAPPPADDAVPVETAAPSGSGYTANVINVPEGAVLVPAAIFYPHGRITEARVVAEKVEKITPKFTKVAVVLNVKTMAGYDAKTDLKATVAGELKNLPIKAVFLLVEKPLDEARRKAVAAQLEPQGIYFQDIGIQQIEKKALYTDMLLGMVFFFDSRKPSGEAA
jgi:hypothetical protein